MTTLLPYPEVRIKNLKRSATVLSTPTLESQLVDNLKSCQIGYNHPEKLKTFKDLWDPVPHIKTKQNKMTFKKLDYTVFNKQKNTFRYGYMFENSQPLYGTDTMLLKGFTDPYPVKPNKGNMPNVESWGYSGYVRENHNYGK